MTLAVRQSTVVKKAANIKVRTATGLKGVENAYIRTAAGLKRFFSKFSITTDSTGTSAGFNSGSTTTLTTRNVTALVTGAVGTVTYLWSQVSGDPMTITNPNSASTAFSALVNPGETLDGVFKCHVTDSGGHSGDTPNIDVHIANHYGGTL